MVGRRSIRQAWSAAASAACSVSPWRGLLVVTCWFLPARRAGWQHPSPFDPPGTGETHEGRHTAVSIMSHNGVPIQDISDTMGHKSTHVNETVYRHVIVPAIRGGASVMDDVFGEQASQTSSLAP
jgi:integrase